MTKKYILFLTLAVLLTACNKGNRLETVNQTIEENQIGESDLTNDITKPAQTNEPRKETLQDTNNIKIDGDIDLSKKVIGDRTSPTPLPTMTTVDELMIEDIKIGTGKEAKNGNMLTVNYEGWLTNGIMFDSSIERGKPFQFELGLGRVIAGWDQGMLGMKEGGKRKLTIPAELGYKDVGAGEVIPPGATLVFEVELLKVE